jgi:hypothetical protein
MSASAPLDIRLPIGMLFTVLGVILMGYGVATLNDPALYSRSDSVNVNLWWGIVMLAFGLGMLLSARFYGGRLSARSADQTPEGRRTEDRERERGIER